MRNQSPTTTSPLERAIAGFSNMLALVCAFFLFPYVTQHFRSDMYHYIAASLDYNWAYWGSWVFVFVVTICCYFGISAFLQLFVQLIFRRNTNKGGF